MPEDFREEIEKDKPFSNLIDIVHISKLSLWGDLAGAYKIQDSHGKFHKLRVGYSRGDAKDVECRMRLVPHIFPKLYGRDRNYLLIEFLEGRTLERNESLDVIFKIGRMCGEAHKFKSDRREEMEARHCNFIKAIFEKKIISAEDYTRFLKIYEEFMRRIDYEVVLTPSDIRPRNFMVDYQNNLYYVDEVGLKYQIRGYSLIYPIITWFTEEQKRTFLEGYDSVNSSAFLDEDYTKFVTFLYYTYIIHHRSEGRKDYSVELKNLLEFKY